MYPNQSERVSARDRLVLREHQLTTREFVNYFASVDSNWSVLEIGCGDGFYLELLRNLGFVRIYGMDEDPELIEIARSKGLRVFEGSVYDLDVHDQIDAVVMCDQLDRLDNPGLAITRIYHALKPEGILYLTTPVVERLTSRFWTKVMKLWSRYEPPDIPNARTTESVSWLLRSHQFNVESCIRTFVAQENPGGYADQWLNLVVRKPTRPGGGVATHQEPELAPLDIDPEVSAEAEDNAPTVIEVGKER